MSWYSAAVESLCKPPAVRSLADTTFGAYARWRCDRLDQQSTVLRQIETLKNLVRRGRRTKFGREHGFSGINSVRDYQARVPLRSYQDFWREYWQAAFPRLDGVTWPDPIPYLALSSGTTTGLSKYIPVSRAMLRSNRAAALTMLAWQVAAKPKSRLFQGQMFFLGGSTSLDSLCPTVRSGDLSGIAAYELPALLRPFTFPPLELALLDDWNRKIQLLAEESCSRNITAVCGVPSWLLVLFDRLRRLSGKSCVADIWPGLQLVIHGGTCFEPFRGLFKSLIGRPDVAFLECYPCSEGFVAAEDPRYRSLRLVPDHGIFFEFVPVSELEAARPVRHTLADIVPGLQYAVAVTTCAGLWSYLLGDTICFERTDPPLLRFTGRTQSYLSAFGEHLINEEVEKAVARATEATSAAATEFHAGPCFAAHPGEPGRHRFLIEFARLPDDPARFASQLDGWLASLNADYRAHRAGNLTMNGPDVWFLKPGCFAAWLESVGRLGGQHKVLRLDNTGAMTGELSSWITRHPHFLWNTKSNRTLSDLETAVSQTTPVPVSFPSDCKSH